jgi:alpha-N-arabinofuranosidase
MNAMNTFDRPGTVQPQPFSGWKLEREQLQITLPAKAIVVLELR